MTDLNYWLVFFTAAVALNVSPGPDILYILSRTIAQGAKVGLASAAGVCSGAIVHVVAAAFGLSAIMAASATAFTVVKYVGAIYLLYLGIQALRSQSASLDLATQKEVPVVSPWQAFRQGVLVDVLNPKAAIFFMAFLPQFVRPDHGSPSTQLVILGLLVILVAITIESILVLAAARSTDFFRRNPKASAWLDRALGTILVSLGIRLALTDHTA
jgi:RhtB (resistance to homoserine/threonine) family protein